MRKLLTLLVPAILVCSVTLAQPDPRKIELVARKFSFEPSRIEVKVGEPVELTFRSADTKHGFACKELGLERVVFSKDEPAVVRFTAEKPGTYEFKCARFCGLGHAKMKGQIVVSP